MGKVGFDAIIGELEQIVGQLEGDDLPLEQSLKVFERGIALSRQGQSILDQAEKRIEVLLRDGSIEAAEAVDSVDAAEDDGKEGG